MTRSGMVLSKDQWGFVLVPVISIDWFNLPKFLKCHNIHDEHRPAAWFLVTIIPGKSYVTKDPLCDECGKGWW